jgi:hypothetical protein
MHRNSARRAKPSSGLEPETPSLPFKSGLSQPVPTCSSQARNSLVTVDSGRDGKAQRNPRRDALMLPNCCPSIVSI